MLFFLSFLSSLLPFISNTIHHAHFGVVFTPSSFSGAVEVIGLAFFGGAAAEKLLNLQPPGLKSSPLTTKCQTPKDMPRGPVAVLRPVRAKLDPPWGLSGSVLPEHPTDAGSDWDKGRWEVRSTPWAVLVLWRGALCHERVYLVFLVCGGIWVDVWHPHDCQDSSFPNRALHCKEMIRQQPTQPQKRLYDLQTLRKAKFRRLTFTKGQLKASWHHKLAWLVHGPGQRCSTVLDF